MLAATNVQTLVIPGCGHFVPEEAPKELLAALTAFLTRNGTDRRALARAGGPGPASIRGQPRLLPSAAA
jgi:hypothetical protein